MSASTQPGETSQQAPPQTNGQTRKKTTRKAGAKKTSAKRAAPQKQQGTTTTLPAPTPARAAAMASRANTHTQDEIALGFANKLKGAGPDWSPEYQQQFMAGLAAALPVICAASGAPAIA